MLVLHAISGCDTVSVIYRIGKCKPFNKREYGMLNLFLNSDSTHEGIQRAGECFLLKLYGASKCASLDELRNICSSSFQLAHRLQQVPQPNNIRFEHISLCRNCSGQTFNNVGPAPLLNEDDNDERSNTDDEDDD